MASFIDKLSLDNLYPTSPRHKQRKNEAYPLFDKFKQEILPLLAMGQMEQTFAPYTNPPVEPTKPMDVIFQPNIGEQAREMAVARDVHGMNLNKNALTPYQAGQLALQDRKLDQSEVIAQSKAGLDAKKIAIAEFKAKNRDHQFIQGKDGRLRAVNPLTKEVTDLGETGMSESEIAALNQTNDLAKIDATGKQAVALEGTRQKGRESMEEVQARHAKELAQLKIEADSKTANLPSQERTATLTKAEQAKNSNPEWSKYIKIVPGGGFTITAPGVFTGPSAETYKAINDYIYGRTPAPKATTSVVSDKPRSRYQVEVR